MTIERVGTETPLGRLTIATREGAVVAAAFDEHWPRARHRLSARFPDEGIVDGPADAEVVKRVRAYLAGDLGAVASVELDLGGTAFQRRIWAALRDVPPGRTLSYAALAVAAGASAATRAAGSACGANPAWLFVPCHRAVRSDGGLGGYAGGIERKRWLLAHERAQAPGTAETPVG